MDWITRSDSLHARVQRLVAVPPSRAEFEALALEIFEYQAEHQPGLGRLRDAQGSIKTVADIPAVPAEVFRFARVAVHPVELDAARFLTSGTTARESGAHAMRRIDTYRALSLGFAREAFGSVVSRRPRVLGLAPTPNSPNTSSLGAMMRFFMEAFDGGDEAWLIEDSGIALGALEWELAAARAEERPILLLATSFALVALLDQLQGRELACPRETLVMQTGGFKGRTREVPAEQLREEVARTLGIEPEFVVGEYGMTELASQLYEGTVPGAGLSSPRGVYVEPPWLQVTPVDPTTLRAVGEGEVGLARIVDLGNVDSAVALLTEDRVRRTDGGIQVLGRRQGAPLRGCSLPFEALSRSPVSP